MIKWFKTFLAFRKLNQYLATEVEFYKSSFAISTDIKLVIDNDTRKIIRCNQAAVDFFALSDDDLLNSNPETLLNIKINGSDRFNKTVRVKNFYLNIVFNRIMINGKKLIFLSIRDISETIEAQHKIILQEQKYYDLFNISNDSIFLFNVFTGQIIDANDVAKEKFEYVNNDFITTTIDKIFIDLSILNDNIKQLHLNFIPYTFFKTKSGVVFQATVTTNYYTESNNLLCFLVIKDIEEEQRITAELKEQSQKLNSMLDISQALSTACSFNDIGEALEKYLNKFKIGDEWGFKFCIYNSEKDIYTIIKQTEPKKEVEELFFRLGGIKTNSPIKFRDIRNFSKKALDSRKTIIIQDNYSDECTSVVPEEITTTRHCMIFIPLIHNELLLGLFSLGRSPHNSLTPDFIQFLESIAKIISIKIHDIFSAEKQLQIFNELKISEEKFFSAFNLAPIPQLIFSKDLKILEANKTFLNMFNFAYDDIKYKKFEDLPIFNTALFYLSSAINSNTEITGYKTKLGDYTSIIYTKPFEFNKEDCWFLAGIDITEEHKIELELRVKDRLLETIAYGMNYLLGNSNINSGIDSIFNMIASIIDADRIYLYRAKKIYNKYYLNMAHEWCSFDTEKYLNNELLYNYPLACLPSSSALEKGMPVLTNTDTLDGDRKELFEKLKIKTVSLVPIMSNGSLWGIIGFDFCRKEHTSKLFETAVIHILGHGILNALIKDDLTRNTNHNYNLVLDILNNIPYRIIYKDVNSKYQFVNQEICNVFNIKDPKLLIGKNDFDFLPEEWATKYYNEEQEIIKTKNAVIDKFHYGPNKKEGYYSKIPIIKDEEVIGLLCISTSLKIYI